MTATDDRQPWNIAADKGEPLAVRVQAIRTADALTALDDAYGSLIADLWAEVERLQAEVAMCQHDLGEARAELDTLWTEGP